MKGFTNIIALVIIGAVSFASAGYLYFVDKQVKEAGEQALGATVLITNTSDTIGTFLSNASTTFDNINTQLETVSTTIDAYGDITSENTPLSLSKGGTGTSTVPTDNYYLSNESGSSTWKEFVGSGVTITHGSTSTTFTSQNIDTSDTYIWTGPHTFSNTVTATNTVSFTATTTLTGNLIASSSANTLATSTFTGRVTFDGGSSVDAATSTFVWPKSIEEHAIATTTSGLSVNTTGFFFGIEVPAKINLAKISILVNAVGVAGVLDFGLYSSDGQNKLLEFTSPTISATGLASATGTAVWVEPGVYYLGIIPNGSANITIDTWDGGVGAVNNLNALATGEPKSAGGISGLTAGTLPSTIDTTALTNDVAALPLRFDD
jgi:hypothetical protein